MWVHGYLCLINDKVIWSYCDNFGQSEPGQLYFNAKL